MQEGRQGKGVWRERKKVMREGGKERTRPAGFSSPAEGPDTPMTY